MRTNTQYKITLPKPHPKQAEFIHSPAKRKIVRAGRRSGKTVGMAIYAVEQFLSGKRVLYAAPTSEQIMRFWTTVTRALDEPIRANVFRKNETEHIIELVGTEQRIRGKTAWNADTLRGDYADVLILDEWQLMNEEAWEVVGAPMLLDNNGDAVFIYTPPSLHSRSTTKATDPQHAAKLYKKAALDTSGRWATFHFSSMENPYISREALQEITTDMTALAYRQEIKAEDVDEAPGALWHRRKTMVGTQEVLGLEDNRVYVYPDLVRVVVAVDPTGTTTGDACGIVGGGMDAKHHHYTVEDASLNGSPGMWAKSSCLLYHKLNADIMVAEVNYGGEMVEKVIKDTDPTINFKMVTATRGKAIRAEPISAMTEHGIDHLVGSFPELEDELCLWIENRSGLEQWPDLRGHVCQPHAHGSPQRIREQAGCAAHTRLELRLALPQRLQDRHQKERVALGFAMQAHRQVRCIKPRIGKQRDQAFRIGQGKSSQWHPARVDFAAQAPDQPCEPLVIVELLVTIGVDHQHRALRRLAGQVLQHLRAGVVGPLDIVDHENRRPTTAPGLKDMVNRARQACLPRLGKVIRQRRQPRSRSHNSGTSTASSAR